MANYYSLRIDALEGITRERIIAFCKQTGFLNHVVVFEISKEVKKLHYQGYIQTDIKHQAYQKRVQTAFPECKSTRQGGRGSYSAGVVKDFDGYSRYIMKGTADAVPDVVCSSYQIDIREAWQQSRVAEENKAKRDTSSCDRSKHIVQRGIEHFKMLDWDRDTDERAKQQSVCRWIMNDLVESGKLIDDFIIRKYINTILSSVSFYSFDYILDRIVDKL